MMLVSQPESEPTTANGKLSVVLISYIKNLLYNDSHPNNSI